MGEMTMGQPSKVWDRFAKRYARSSVSDESAYQKKLQVTREYFDSDTEVLELGCGTGSTAIAHAPYVKHILAVDFSKKMLEIAQAKADEADVENVTFKQSGVEELDVAGRSFDVVMAHSILHLLDNKEEVIETVYDLLEPGGVFVSSTICMGGRFHAMRLILPIGRYMGLLPLVRFFTVDELVESMTNVGFEVAYQWQPNAKSALFLVAKKPLPQEDAH